MREEQAANGERILENACRGIELGVCPGIDVRPASAVLSEPRRQSGDDSDNPTEPWRVAAWGQSADAVERPKGLNPRYRRTDKDGGSDLQPGST